MTFTGGVLQSLMEEVNLNPRMQHELLNCAKSGKSFPFVPRSLSQSTPIPPAQPKNSLSLKLPPRPIQRPKSTILKLGNYERDKFRPNPSKTRPPHEKQRLQNLMAYGKDIDEELTNLSYDDEQDAEEDPSVDMFVEISMEIKERREFLDQMTALGKGKKYLPEIQCQIALRLKELEKIDKKRAHIYFQKYGM